MLPRSTDVLIIGGGIVGLTLALEAKRVDPSSRVVLLDKDDRCGSHASSRNSGVLHAGFYYSADSLKARFCREGNAAWKRWCAEHDLAVNPCGKLVVARNEDEVPILRQLLARGQANGVSLRWVDPEEARELEPRVKTTGGALYSPTTATVAPAAVVESVVAAVRAAGVEVCTGVRWLSRRGTTQLTSAGEVEAGLVINAAGLYADRVAAAFGFGLAYRILPFKGVYLLGEPSEVLRCAVYPVPLAGNAFLGVHFTPAVDGTAKIGPTAIPALWREQYGGLTGFSAAELGEVVATQASLATGAAFDFWGLAWQEARKQWRGHMVRLSGTLLEGVEPDSYRHWGRPGIRAQLLHAADKALVSDFVLEGDERSLHVLNAVSPAFTCALPFARHCWERITGTDVPR